MLKELIYKEKGRIKCDLHFSFVAGKGVEPLTSGL